MYIAMWLVLFVQQVAITETRISCNRKLKLLSVGMGLALDRSGWTMSVVLVLNHVSSPAQTEELDHTTVVILRMWPYTAVLVPVRHKFTLFPYFTHIKGKICVPSH